MSGLVPKKMTIVVGGGYGDEGKGVDTVRLCRESEHTNTIVVRSNGGPNAGHEVDIAERHVACTKANQGGVEPDALGCTAWVHGCFGFGHGY